FGSCCLLPWLCLHPRRALHIQASLVQHQQKIAHDHKKVGPLFPPGPPVEIIPRAAHQRRDPTFLVFKPVNIRLTLAHESSQRLSKPSIFFFNPFNLRLQKNLGLLEGQPESMCKILGFHARQASAFLEATGGSNALRADNLSDYKVEECRFTVRALNVRELEESVELERLCSAAVRAVVHAIARFQNSF
ncbi:ER-resident heat shock protein, partial [Striga asiatica]